MTSPNSTAGAGFCAACGAALSAGARFCHRCGTPVGQGLPSVAARSAQPASGVAAVLPWGVAFVALLALIAMVAGKNFGKPQGSSLDGSANSLPTQALDGQGAQGGAPFAGGAGGAAPNIANLSPSERANKLYIRIMEYAEMGKVDSVAFFAPMALASHEMLEGPTLDERYHYGRIAEVTGNAEVAKAQADIILKEQPENLLGLLLAARVARLNKDENTAKGFDARLLKALAPQLATQAEEYTQHRSEIDRAVADAQKK